MTDKQIGFITMEKATNRPTNSVGSSRIRAKWVYKYWDEAEEWIIGQNYETLIFQKVYWDRMMDEYKGIKILDVCFAGDTLILTSRGWKKIKDIQIGELVVTHKGRFKKVTKTMRRFASSYKVKMGYLPNIITTGNHPFMSSFVHTNGYGKREFSPWDWCRADQLDPVMRHKEGNMGASLITRVYEQTPIGQELAWLLGFYIADGTYSDHQISFSFDVNNIKLREKLLKTIKNLGYKPSYREVKDNLGQCGIIYFTSHELVSYIKEFIGVKQHKKIPLEVYSTTVFDKLKFLEGYLEGDGCLSDKGGITSNSISKYISYGIWQIYRDCGINASISYHPRQGEVYEMIGSNGKKYNSKPQWAVRLNPSESLKFIKHSKPDFTKENYNWSIAKSKNHEVTIQDNYYAHPIRSIEKSIIIPVYNITVEDDHSYIADGAVVSNCDPDWLERDFFKYIDKVDAVTTSTENLATYIEKFRGSWNNKNIIVKCIPDRIDFQEHKQIKMQHTDKITKLVWFGYSHNFHYLEDTFEILDNIGIELTIISDKQVNLKKEYKNIQLIWKQYNYEKLHEILIQHDAALFPDRKNLDGTYSDYKAQFKSNNKRLTCMALKLPIIETPDDLTRLATKESRIEESNNKLRYVEENYDVRTSVKEYKELIEGIKQIKH